MVTSLTKDFFKSLRHAFRGFKYMTLREKNFRIELIAGALVFVAAFYIGVEKWELVSLTFIIFIVLILEAINTLVERLVNIFNPRVHPYAKMLKDVTASIVLIGSIGSIIIGIIVFWPYVF
jgi:diacylglycerol kinase